LNYILLLASTGKTEEQLLTFGMAYLKEILEPDPAIRGAEAVDARASGLQFVPFLF
jgi:hypothetical protein